MGKPTPNCDHQQLPSHDHQPPHHRPRWRRIWLIPVLILATSYILFTACGCSLFRFRISDDYSSSTILASPPAIWSTPARLRVVTYNVKDLIWLSDHRVERMRAIGETLVGLAPDVVCLQEGFSSSDIAEIRNTLTIAGLVHVQDYPSGAVGSGLWILSRYPIRETFFWKYTMNGEWYELSQGDWWAGKGIALARLELAQDMYLDIYNTHMIAGYGVAPNQDDRAVQARELVSFVRQATPKTVPAVLAGDFNCADWAEEYRHMQKELAWTRVMTQETRLDHVFGFCHDKSYEFRPDGDTVSIFKTIQVGAASTSLSDHSGFLTTLVIRAVSED
ncbi:MAG: endonuclease/exonuclease/phosphatase family protein [Planctomycetota bacterium]